MESKLKVSFGGAREFYFPSRLRAAAAEK